LDHWKLIQRLIANGLIINALFGLPFFNAGLIFRIDWMHATDLGVGADFVGQLFVHLIEKMPGANIQHRLNALWHRILAGYERHVTESKLDNLTLAMLKYGKPTSPKLKAHAAEVRGLIPIARDLVELLLDDADPIDHTVKMAMVSLSACYDCLSADHPSPNAFKDHSRRFASLFVALEQRTTTFGIRPKLHMFQELCEMTVGSRPAAHWTYRDEDFGGSLVALAKRRGGRTIPKTIGCRVLSKFMARHKLPWL